MEIKYDVPFEVTEKQYHKVMKEYGTLVAGRKDENGKYFIKVWFMKYAEKIKSTLSKIG